MSHSGRIGWRKATLRRDDADRLMLRWGAVSVDLAEVVVRHRDDGGRIAFSLAHAGTGEVLRAARYRRRGPRPWNVVMDAIDFTADEPWTWEDGDFGLFVFHVATGTGPVKYRHRIQPRARADGDAVAEGCLAVTDAGLVRTRPGGRAEHVEFAALAEVRVKFELSGIWAEAALLTLDSPGDLAVVPLGSSRDVDRVEREVLPRLRGLPGWDAAAEAAVQDACEYALRDAVGPAPGEHWSSRAERPVWRRPRGGASAAQAPA